MVSCAFRAPLTNDKVININFVIDDFAWKRQYHTTQKK
jgi:hypothetical protein